MPVTDEMFQDKTWPTVETYNNILSRLEGVDVMGIVHIIHLLQDSRHAR